MNLAEAVSLLEEGLVDMVIGHHFGLFEFNTINFTEVNIYLNQMKRDIRNRFRLADLAVEYSMRPSTEEVP